MTFLAILVLGFFVLHRSWTSYRYINLSLWLKWSKIWQIFTLCLLQGWRKDWKSEWGGGALWSARIHPLAPRFRHPCVNNPQLLRSKILTWKFSKFIDIALFLLLGFEVWVDWGQPLPVECGSWDWHCGDGDRLSSSWTPWMWYCDKLK